MGERSDQPRDPHAPHTTSPADLLALHEAQRSGAPFLAWRDVNDRLRLLVLRDEAATYAIGRAPSTAISLGWDETVSWLHAELRCVDGAWYVVDDSTNGTSVGGRRVRGRTRLYDDDRLRVGEVPIAFHGPGNGAQPAKTTAANVSLERGDLDATERAILIAACRPCLDDRRAEPATTKAIAGEVHMNEDAVRRRLGKLYGRFGIGPLDPGAKKRRLVDLALETGIVSRRDYAP